MMLRHHLVTLQNGINSVRIDILSISDHVSVTGSQKLKPILLSPSDLKLLLTKLESQLALHPYLALPQWEGGNIWNTYKFMKLWSFMLSDTLYVVLHIPLVDKLLQFNIFRIHNILLVHPALKKLFKYSIQKDYLAITSDSQDISFPLSANIMACQVWNGQFCDINSSLYMVDTSQSCSYTLFLINKAEISSVCILSVLNQTQDQEFNTNDNFGQYPTSRMIKKLYTTSLQSTYTIKPIFP